MSDNDKRQYPRTPMVCRIKIQHESIGEMVVQTRDISDGGVFVVMDGEQMPPEGAIVSGQVQGMMHEAPVVSMEVVRVEPQGLGLKFVNF